MKADIVGALEQLDKSWKAFEHKGKPLTKEQVRKVLVYGIQKGYKDTGQLTDEEVDNIILFDNMKKGKNKNVDLRDKNNAILTINGLWIGIIKKQNIGN